MAIIRSIGTGAADLVGLARALGRAGPGALTADEDGDVFEWAAPGGVAWQARGEGFAVDPVTGAASGAPRVLSLAAGGFSIAAEGSGTLGLLLGLLADEQAPGPDALDAALAGSDRLQAFGSGGAALFGDAFRAVHLMEAEGDAYDGGPQGGGRRVSGDFWTVAAEAAQVFGGADVLREAGLGPLSLWGDAALMEDRAVADGALLIGGDDLIDASAAGMGAAGAARALIGDVGAVGRNWDVEGGADVLRGPEGGAALVGDAGLLGDGARLVGGDDDLRGGAGDDALYGEAQRVGEGALLIAGADRLFGGAGDDRIWGEAREVSASGAVMVAAPGSSGGSGGGGGGGGGGDRIVAGAGADQAWGGAGGDRLFGGAGADRLRGGTGRDRLEGGAGRDALRGDGGDDALNGGAGRDALIGAAGADVLRGGRGADRLQGAAGADRLSGGAGADRLIGGADADRLFGGAGADRLIAGDGRDVLEGGRGADVFVLRPGDDRNRIVDFEAGEDALSLGAAADVAVARNGSRGVQVTAQDLWLRLEGVTLAELAAADSDWLG